MTHVVQPGAEDVPEPPSEQSHLVAPASQANVSSHGDQDVDMHPPSTNPPSTHSPGAAPVKDVDMHPASPNSPPIHSPAAAPDTGDMDVDKQIPPVPTPPPSSDRLSPVSSVPSQSSSHLPPSSPKGPSSVASALNKSNQDSTDGRSVEDQILKRPLRSKGKGKSDVPSVEKKSRPNRVQRRIVESEDEQHEDDEGSKTVVRPHSHSKTHTKSRPRLKGQVSVAL